MDVIWQYGIQGVLAFGAVGVITNILDKYTKVKLDSDTKFYLLVGIAFLTGFIPADLGSDLFNRIKIAIGVGVRIHALWTVRKS